LRVGDDAESEEGRCEKGFGIGVEPLEFENWNGKRNSDGDGEERRDAGRSGFDGDGGILFFFLSGCRVMEGGYRRSGPRSGTL